MSTAVNMNLLFVSLHAGSGRYRSTTILRKGSSSIAILLKEPYEGFLICLATGIHDIYYKNTIHLFLFCSNRSV